MGLVAVILCLPVQVCAYVYYYLGRGHFAAFLEQLEDGIVLMGKTIRSNPDPERVKRVQELRRSNAAGPIDGGRDKQNTLRAEIAEQWEDYEYLSEED